ncbi:DUF3054 domain-containing protein [Cryobacterium arcticum]|uniref:DUF3054 domain-containing protein n=1 Tax=Cryobacterium arcticum TaxID=670052 RepID=A0A317ZTX0_9MICO|nr:DUF3054 domain-containing protein [Cryobacterium arcticum]PXA68583.1 DUF3054 domain-containing protein [Cryobacterium arcticum]
MQSRRVSPAVIAFAGGLDAALLLLFVLIGRASHGESLLGVLTTWWPFLAGLAVGWLVTRAWREPLGIRWTGLGIVAVTVLVGLLLRVVSGQGVQLSFVIVTIAVIAVFLLGWRAIGVLVRRLRRRSGPTLERAR